MIALTVLAVVFGSTEPKTTGLGSVHCIGASANFACSMERWERTTLAFGASSAMKGLRTAYARSAEVASDCHQLSHVIGNASVALHDRNIAAAFAEGDSFCWSGYYHGVVERAIVEVGERTVLEHADSLCAAIPGKERYSFDYFNCVHGLGHGIMAIKDGELFDSLVLCDRLTGEWERKSCYGGAFMENIMVDNRTHRSKYLSQDDLLYPCTAVDDRYKEQCYLMQTSFALSRMNYDFQRAFALCATVSGAFRGVCMQSIGRDASGYSISDVARTTRTCALAETENDRAGCLEGAVKDFISYFHDDVRARELCAAQPATHREGCERVRESYLRNL